MPRLKIISKRGGFATERAIRISQHWNQARPQMRRRLPPCLGHDDPVEGNAAVAHQGPKLDRVRRRGRADERVAWFGHGGSFRWAPASSKLDAGDRSISRLQDERV